MRVNGWVENSVCILLLLLNLRQLTLKDHVAEIGAAELIDI
jgi:hypothetical protein